MNYVLSEARLPIREALERLVEKDERRHPIVLVIKVGDPELFVRFAKRDDELCFDVPKIGIVSEFVTPLLGTDRAVETFVLAFEVREDERVLIFEEEGRPKRSSFLEKLLAWAT